MVGRLLALTTSRFKLRNSFKPEARLVCFTVCVFTQCRFNFCTHFWKKETNLNVNLFFYMFTNVNKLLITMDNTTTLITIPCPYTINSRVINIDGWLIDWLIDWVYQFFCFEGLCEVSHVAVKVFPCNMLCRSVFDFLSLEIWMYPKVWNLFLVGVGSKYITYMDW